MNINITEKFPKKNFKKRGYPYMILKNFPEKFCVKGRPLYMADARGVCKGGNGGRGFGGGTPIYNRGRGIYRNKKSAL